MLIRNIGETEYPAMKTESQNKLNRPMSCYYRILGVSIEASQEEIKGAFRKLALRWHPDRNENDAHAAEHFRTVHHAYEHLMDPQKRRIYDRENGYKPSRNSTSSEFCQWEREGEETSFADVLREAFGIRSKRASTTNSSRHPYDLRFDLQIAREEADCGAYEWIQYEKRVFCACRNGGSSMLSGTCGYCGGEGTVLSKVSLRLKVPPGSQDGSRLRITGAGDQFIETGQTGDLVVLLHVVENKGNVGGGVYGI